MLDFLQKPYFLFQKYPFPRPHSRIEKMLDAIGANRYFLREGKRPHFRVDKNVLTSPVEGKLVEIQTLSSSQDIKGKSTFSHTERHTFAELVHETHGKESFENGLAFNFYLNPFNLHYLLFPYDLTIQELCYHPAFCRPILFMKSGEIHNERLVLYTKTPAQVPVILILIGSFLVSGIECIAESGKSYSQGELLGGFKLGSTVMMLFPRDSVESLIPIGSKVLLGEPFAKWT